MLVHLARFTLFLNLGERADAQIFVDTQQRQVKPVANWQTSAGVAITARFRVNGDICQNDERRLQPLCAMNRHDLHFIASGKAFAFYFAGIALKPVEELLQSAAARLFEFNCEVENLLNWNEHLLAEPCDKFLSSPRRAG